jgi:hypothetical protein
MADHNVVPEHSMLEIDGITGAAGGDFLYLVITLTEIVATANTLA